MCAEDFFKGFSDICSGGFDARGGGPRIQMLKVGGGTTLQRVIISK